MLDSPITLILLGISAASALASYTAARRRRRTRPVPPVLATLSDQDLAALLAALQPRGTSISSAAQRGAAHTAPHSASEMREARHPVSASWVEHDTEVRRRITLLIVEEIERRQLSSER